jgi:hypothetical protein
MRSIVHVVSIIVLASIYARTAVHTPPAQAAIAAHGAPAAAGNGSCRTKPSGSVRASRERKSHGQANASMIRMAKQECRY